MKKTKTNRSELIREHLKTAKDTMPAAVVKAMAKKGIKVSRGLVSVVKHSRRKGFKASRLAKHADAIAKHADAIAKVKKFIEESGGISEAKSLIDVVGKIM